MASGTITKSKFLPYDLSTTYSSVDLNDFTDAGIYIMSGSLTNNAGGNNYGLLVVLVFNTNYITQLFYGTGSNNIYKRIYNAGTWDNWYYFTGTEIT